MKIKNVPSMHSVWLIVILKLHVDVQNVFQQQGMSVVVMEKHMSMNVNCGNNLVQRKLTLKFFMMANVVSFLRCE